MNSIALPPSVRAVVRAGVSDARGVPNGRGADGILFMRPRFHIDPETGLPHIAEHGVTEDEVGEVLRRPGRSGEARKGLVSPSARQEQDVIFE